MLNRLSTQTKILLTSSAGALFECYDFMICVFMSGILIKVFFAGNVWLGVFSIFTVAFISRPIGGIFWGHFGDKFGRKKVFSLTMLLMVVPTLLIAVFPTNLPKDITIGGFILMRFLQGFLVGGEFSGGITFISEIVSPKSRATLVAVFMAILSIGTLIASLVGFIMRQFFSAEQLELWAWRLPFILSIVLVFTAMYIRNKVQETPAFVLLQNHNGVSKAPLIELVKYYPFMLFSGVVIACLSGFGLITLYLFLPNIIQLKPFIGPQDISLITTISLFLLIVFMPIWGFFADRFSRKSVLLVSSILLLFCLRFDSIAIIDSSHILLFIGMLLSSIAFAGISGVYGTVLSELFPTRVRFSGVALCYSVGYSLCGGLLPLLYLSNLSLTRLFYTPIMIFLVLFTIVFFIRPFIKDYSRKPLPD